MSTLIIRGGRVLDPAGGFDAVADVWIENGRIAAVGENLEREGAAVLDARGKIVAPGFIDLRARLREPGLEHAETIESGSRAAAAGGFTTVCCLPNTTPYNDSATVTSFIVDRAVNRAAVRVLPIGGLTKDGAGEQLAEIGAMKEAGVAAVGDADSSVMDAALMKRALRYAASFDLTVLEHCEDANLGGGDIHDGSKSMLLGLTGDPVSAETVILARDVILCREASARIHFAHLSSAAAVALVRQAKADGAAVTADAGAAYLDLTVEDVVPFDSNYKVRPPFREASDREALIQALVDGTLDAVVSDHAPHTGNVKMQELESCPPGITGLETAVSIAIERLLHTKRMEIGRFVELFTSGPARVLRRDTIGSLAIGGPGDVTVLDLEREWVFDSETSLSKSKNSPFRGRVFRGGPAATIVGGRVVWSADTGIGA
ncbi:MAG: dihydroorotase [Bryobacterales bacterium]|nr:dihydroorotase [Bryobacterales bacterium]